MHTAPGEPVSIDGRTGAGFRLADDDLAGYVVLDFDAFDDWYEEDERVDVFLDGQRREPPRGPFADAVRDEFGV